MTNCIQQSGEAPSDKIEELKAKLEVIQSGKTAHLVMVCLLLMNCFMENIASSCQTVAVPFQLTQFLFSGATNTFWDITRCHEVTAFVHSVEKSKNQKRICKNKATSGCSQLFFPRR